MLNYIIVAVLSYLLGSISFGMIVAKLAGGPNLREVGSKNTGASNVLRTMGVPAAAITFVGDILKALLPAVIGRLLFGLNGAMVGGLLVLGLYGVSDAASVASYWKQLREGHDGMDQCRDLLRVNAEKGLPKKPHCDGMVYEAVELTEKILREQGKID